MSKPADCERTPVVREAAVRSALCPQPDTVTEGNWEEPRRENTSVCYTDVLALR